MTGNAPLIVGCDAGGSSVAAVAWRDGAVVGHGKAGSANPVVSGVAEAAAAIARAVSDAAGTGARIAVLYAGVAGAGRAHIASALQQSLRERLPGVSSVIVEDDTRIALRAAIPVGPGVVVIAGTGSVAYAEHDGVRVRVGGTGFLIGDDGSAFAIGRAAVRKLGRVYDGSAPPSALTYAVERTLGVSSRDELLDAVYAGPSASSGAVALIASLAPEVLSLAAQSERAARSIVRGAAVDLASLVACAARSVQLSRPRVALSGGLLERESVLSELLRTGVRAALPDATFVVADGGAEIAALGLARELLSSSIPS